jgi:hypothetical protein
VHRWGDSLSRKTTIPFQATIPDTEKNHDLTVSIPTRDPATEWTPKTFQNSHLARSAAILLTLAAVGFSGHASLDRISGTTAAMIHLFSYSTWFGSIVYTTFFAGVTMFQNLPRHTFGRLQGKLFPKYFGLSSISVLLQVCSTLFICFLWEASSFAVPFIKKAQFYPFESRFLTSGLLFLSRCVAHQ